MKNKLQEIINTFYWSVEQKLIDSMLNRAKAHEAARSVVRWVPTSHLLPLTRVIKTHLSRWDATLTPIKKNYYNSVQSGAAHLDRNIKQLTWSVTWLFVAPVRWFNCQEVRGHSRRRQRQGSQPFISFWPVSSSEQALPTSYNESYTPPEKINNTNL